MTTYLHVRLREANGTTRLERERIPDIKRVCDAHKLETVAYFGKKCAVHIIYKNEAYLISTEERWATFRQEVHI